MTETTAKASSQDAAHLRTVARRSVRHFQSPFDELEQLAPGAYPRMIVRGSGAYLYDAEGRKLLNGTNSLAATVVGHGRPEYAEALAAQVTQLEFGALDSAVSHLRVAELAERLGPLLPVDGPVFSFCGSGSEANELAFKIVRAYHELRGEPRRKKILARAGSYHGATYSAMTATGVPPVREPFSPLAPGIVRVGATGPGKCGFCTKGEGCQLTCARDLENVILREGPDTIAAILAEPVAIAGTVKLPVPEYWTTLRDLCDRYGILLIGDEVICGFGRTGRWFGLQHFGIEPDVMTMGKGLTSGYVPMGAMVTAGRVEEAFGDQGFANVNTWAGHPLSCVAALVTIDILEREGLVERAASLEPVVARCQKRLQAAVSQVVDWDVIGLLSSVEIDGGDGCDARELGIRYRHACYERGLIIRTTPMPPHRVGVHFYPPLVVDEQDVERAFAIMEDAAAEVFAGAPGSAS